MLSLLDLRNTFAQLKRWNPKCVRCTSVVLKIKKMLLSTLWYFFQKILECSATLVFAMYCNSIAIFLFSELPRYIGYIFGFSASTGQMYFPDRGGTAVMSSYNCIRKSVIGRQFNIFAIITGHECCPFSICEIHSSSWSAETQNVSDVLR